MPHGSLAGCNHLSICYVPSHYASIAGYTRPDISERLSATKPKQSSRKVKPNLSERHNEKVFPAPLVLPGDDLAEDPEYPAQSFQTGSMKRNAT
ncbi:hypothetical protein N7468_009218 [Penicillium chermesinum]|uniref:Uncharacterized protein n=1 Tax=Penicillium chermesinum TaxID=63820 RepID=A0A9W9NJV6_9EURO|nr:uncharacterized protein N7468_009218 [Penicillium chermesinum]KAJ5220014.1 hypothetical protein N7468_009218 [Penicillium chermesinum]